MAEQAPNVVLEHVTRRFSETVLGLDDVSLSFQPGEITVLLGMSGSGKSTLLRHINGLQQPTSGSVQVLGRRIERVGQAELRRLRREVGFIFQDFHLVGPLSVLENVCTGRLGFLSGPRLTLASYPRRVKMDAMAQLERVGLADRAHQRADTLSGGQQQRVAIARALVQQPKILLADEPVASLDPVSASQVIDLIAQISRDDDLTVVCSLHQVELAITLGDRIVGLRKGRVVMDRRTEGIRPEEVMEVYDQVAVVPQEELAADQALVGAGR
ncbi:MULTISPECIES: phosphonate ABC transporter ATP-binding protein [unclassified Luteococcus]|uniref:phosphonate ABC transporter ATP-binding protein n=1 Tax=unclassified Luteococcus TaxID=2639923 RepID=UPI00313CE5E4